VKLPGRLIGIRKHGGSTFANIQDSSGKIQVYFRRNIIGDEKYKLLSLLNIGDFIGVRGPLFETKTGEQTILVKDFVLLSKSLYPLPEKWHGLQDIELRYKKRWLDLIMNEEVREKFIVRSKIINGIRQWLNSRGFLEVDTPILQPIYGGALAQPFKSHYNALNRDFFLRISDELYLKRLLIGGIEKVYEIGRDFRNEGMDRLHNPEFTMIELYEAYRDYNDMMNLVEELFEKISLEINQSLKMEYEGREISFRRPWKRIPFFDAIKEHTRFSLKTAKEDEIRSAAKKLGVEVRENIPSEKVLDNIFGSCVQPKIIEPTFVIDYPISLSPLAKAKKDDKSLVERFEPIICGIEFGNAFSELNDPLEQYERFKEQMSLRQRGDNEAQVMDEDFVSALETGMPPVGGLGLGIDRLVMLFTNSHSLKEIILFPQMREKG
jgi:lysyl-tRNA synthetase class 2